MQEVNLEELSLLELQELRRKTNDYNMPEFKARLELKIAEWGTVQGKQYRIM